MNCAQLSKRIKHIDILGQRLARILQKLELEERVIFVEFNTSKQVSFDTWAKSYPKYERFQEIRELQNSNAEKDGATA